MPDRSAHPAGQRGDDRATRIAAAFAGQAMSADGGNLCAACVDVLGVSGAGIMLMSGANSGPVCSSTTTSRVLEDLQFTLGEGPCQDAYHSGAPVLVPHLDDAASGRWPLFTPSAMEAGVHALFAYPLRSEGLSIGALTLYQEDGGALTTAQQDDVDALTAVLTRTILSTLDGAQPGELPESLDDASAHRAEVHQATGMVSVQLQVNAHEALARIRAFAFAEGRSTGDVAIDIVARRLRLAPDEAVDDGQG